MNGGTVLIFDQGLFPYLATALALSFDRVLYHSVWHEAFPVSRKTMPGVGLPGVERVNHFFDHVDEADLIVFPDVGYGDLQMYLRDQGKRVWGSAGAEVLELDRVGLVELMRAKKMDGADGADVIPGIDALEEHLRETDDRYVKLGFYRGDFETMHHKDWWRTEPVFSKKRHAIGPAGAMLEFVSEEPVDGVEVGYDGYCIDGEFPPVCVYGYEAKDAAYLGRVVPYHQLPGVLRDVNQSLAEPLGELGCRSMFSTEVRVRPDGTGVLIDPTLRMGSPPGAVMLRMFDNWDDIILGGSEGLMVPPKVRARYGAQVMLKSPWAKDEFLALRFPESSRPWLALHGHFIVGGVDYVTVAGQDMTTIGAACGIGDTAKDAREQALAIAESVEGYEVTYDTDAFDVIEEQIEAGMQSGIEWE